MLTQSVRSLQHYFDSTLLRQNIKQFFLENTSLNVRVEGPVLVHIIPGRLFSKFKKNEFFYRLLFTLSWLVSVTLCDPQCKDDNV